MIRLQIWFFRACDCVFSVFMPVAWAQCLEHMRFPIICPLLSLCCVLGASHIVILLWREVKSGPLTWFASHTVFWILFYNPACLPKQKPKFHPGLFFLRPAHIQLAIYVLSFFPSGNLSACSPLFWPHGYCLSFLKEMSSSSSSPQSGSLLISSSYSWRNPSMEWPSPAEDG